MATKPGISAKIFSIFGENKIVNNKAGKYKQGAIASAKMMHLQQPLVYF